MEYLLYASTGFAAATLGALPPGAVNLSVVYTTLNKGAKFAIPIILAAAVGEILLSLFALSCAMTVEEYIEQNLYVQYCIAILLIIAGVFLLLHKPKVKNPDKPKKNNGFLKGLLLAVLNPPVLIYWLVAFAFISSNGLMVNLSLIELSLIFFAGIFVGKIFTLWLYLQLSKRIVSKASHLIEKLNKGIAVLLVILGCVQLVKLLLEV
ncbi:MAG: LysE family transporter [Chitinophagales bacterium]|nr:LysE family transporter [Chitinophagales bacterium]